MAAIDIDESGWPIVVVRWPNGPVSDAELERFIARSAAQLARRQRYGTLHDGVRASGLDGRQRARMAEHVASSHDELARWHVAAAIVSSSAIVRGIVAAVNWLSPSPFPQRQFATHAEAETWLREMLEGATRSEPPR